MCDLCLLFAQNLALESFVVKYSPEIALGTSKLQKMSIWAPYPKPTAASPDAPSLDPPFEEQEERGGTKLPL